jgi:hypothetical protein
MKKFNFVFSLYDETLNLSKEFITYVKSIKLKEHDFQKNSFYSKEKQEELIQKTINEIENYIYRIIKDLNYSRYEFRDAWVQKYDKPGNFHDCHIHDPYLYSFVLYVDCSKKSSETMFYNPGYPNYCTDTMRVKPKKGRCIIFNGAIPHSALPNFDKKRLVVSGNIKFIK